MNKIELQDFMNKINERSERRIRGDNIEVINHIIQSGGILSGIISRRIDLMLDCLKLSSLEELSGSCIVRILQDLEEIKDKVEV